MKYVGSGGKLHLQSKKILSGRLSACLEKTRIAVTPFRHGRYVLNLPAPMFSSLSLSDWVAVTNVVVAVIALVVGCYAVVIARQTLHEAKEDWKQRKWFDLYSKADEAYDALDLYQGIYGDDKIWTPQRTQDFNAMMSKMRQARAMAVVFPKNPATAELIDATAFAKNPGEAVTEAMSKERLQKLMNAVSSLYEQSLVNKDVLLQRAFERVQRR